MANQSNLQKLKKYKAKLLLVMVTCIWPFRLLLRKMLIGTLFSKIILPIGVDPKKTPVLIVNCSTSYKTAKLEIIYMSDSREIFPYIEPLYIIIKDDVHEHLLMTLGTDC